MLALLRDLMDFMKISAPSGYEQPMGEALKERLLPYCQSVTFDKVGNCIGKIPGTDPEAPRLMIFAHLDQLGFIVRRVEPDGYLQVDRLGGIAEKVLPGLNITVRGEDGSWHPAVFGNKAHHATPAAEKYIVDEVTSLFLDMGARSAEEVHAMGIYTGCPAVYAPFAQRISESRVSGTAVDDRGGCASLVEIARLLQKEPPRCDVYLVGTVWEEFNLRGAMMAARSIHPQVALCLDVALASDTRDLQNRFDNRMGEGPTVHLYSFHGRGTLNGTLPHLPLFDLCKRTAAEEGIPIQRFASLGILTDAAYLQLEEEGVACLELGYPARYTHTPVEMCDISDLERLSALSAGIARRLDGGFSLHRYGKA